MTDTAKEPPPKRQLGRGLSALLGDLKIEPTPQAAPTQHATPAPRGVRPIPTAQILPGAFQPRRDFEPGAFDELVASVKAQGVLQPILVRRHPLDTAKFEIIAGERRWRAAQAAQLHEIPALVRDLSDSEALAAALIENLQRQDLNAIEEAVAYRRLIDEFGQTQEQVAEGLGKSRPHVSNTVRLLELPSEVQEMVRRKALSAGHARVLVTAADPLALAKRIIAEGMSVRQAEALAGKMKARPAKPAASERLAGNADTRALERSLSESLGLRVTIETDKNGRAGSVSIHYQTLDQLDELLTKLTGEPKF